MQLRILITNCCYSILKKYLCNIVAHYLFVVLLFMTNTIDLKTWTCLSSKTVFIIQATIQNHVFKFVQGQKSKNPTWNSKKSTTTTILDNSALAGDCLCHPPLEPGLRVWFSFIWEHMCYCEIWILVLPSYRP